MRVAIVARRATATNRLLAATELPGCEVLLLGPCDALLRLEPGDVAVGRLAVKPSLDGVEDGLSELSRLPELGVTVLNPTPALLGAHDKLLTARLLRRASVPHPREVLLERRSRLPRLRFPVALKPRFGWWGRDARLCADRRELDRSLDELAFLPWFRSCGVMAQELVPGDRPELKLLVAGGRVLGATVDREPADPSAEACELALAAAAAIGGHLVGVDLLPLPAGGWTVIELHGAVDFPPALSGRGDVFEATLAALVAASPRSAKTLIGTTDRR